MDCLRARDQLANLIMTELPQSIYRVLPYSPWINLLPVVMAMDKREIPEKFCAPKGLLEPYHLRKDFFPSNPANPNSCPDIVYKLCVMPHLFRLMQNGQLDNSIMRRFVEDIKTSDQIWHMEQSKTQ